MNDAADIDIVIRKGRQFTTDYQIADFVPNEDPDPQNLTGATFVMQFRDVRGAAGVLDLTPVFSEIDLSIGSFNFTATSILTDAMATTSGFWEIRRTFNGILTTPFEGAYSVTLPVVQ